MSCFTVDGQWGEWSPVASCSATCGPGHVAAERHCNMPPPQFGGKNCTGITTKAVLCSSVPCPGEPHSSCQLGRNLKCGLALNNAHFLLLSDTCQSLQCTPTVVRGQHGATVLVHVKKEASRHVIVGVSLMTWKTGRC